MNHHNSRLNQHPHEQAHQHQRQQAASETQVIEFANAEEALRYDASQIPVPPRIAERLQKSIQDEPRTTGLSWWRRWFRN
jgi:hypothetical protein